MTIVTAGIDVGSSAVKGAIVLSDDGGERVLASAVAKIRKREVARVVEEIFDQLVAEAGVDELAYVATTGEGEEIPFATGHFYGMTTHARGALFLEPRARFVLDVGALHARAVAMDASGRVTDYKMTSQCASGSGQFLENIARYLGITQSEIGSLSLTGKNPEKVSSICAVLAETDVINMVSRGISAPDILRGIHESMAGRFARLLLSIGATDVVFLSGGLAGDRGLEAALTDAIATMEQLERIEIATDDSSVMAGALGAALLGAYRWRKIGTGGMTWKPSSARTSSFAR